MTTTLEGREMRYNPRYTKPFAKVYRPWFFVAAIFLILFGVGSIACSIAVKELYDDIHIDLYQLWVGIPLLGVGIISVIVFMTRSRRLATLFLMISLIMMAVCASAAMIGGLRFWRDGWSGTRRKLNQDGECSVINNACFCRNVIIPAQIKSCSDLEQIADLLISEIALAAGGFLFCVMATYLTMMAICCGPWQHIDENVYDKQYDPDLTNPNGVQIRSMHRSSSLPATGKNNPAYSG